MEITKVKVKGGLIYDMSCRWAVVVKVIRGREVHRPGGVVPLYHADEIAYKNGLVCAERFTKKYEGKKVELDFDTLKVLKVT